MRLEEIIYKLSLVYPKEEAEELAYWLVEERKGWSKWEVFAHRTCIDIADMDGLVERLCAKEPIQYVLGHTRWMGLDLKVSSETLIPRPETAELVERVEQDTMGERGMKVLDIGTGTGCIAIALKQRHPEWDVWAMDISEGALAVAKENAERNSVDIHWIKGDIFVDEIGGYDLIVSNPPYISECEKKAMEDNVLLYEPAAALFVPDEDPLCYYQRIAQIKKAPRVFFEISQYQSEAMRRMMEREGYTDICIYKDSYGNERIFTARVAM